MKESHKFQIGDRVIVTYQYDIEDCTRAEGVIVNTDIDLEPATIDRLVYYVECKKNPLMNGWYGENNLERISKAKKSKPKKQLRKVGDIMLDMEKLLLELHEGHDMQHGEVLYLINGWQKIHVPRQIETYDDGTHPVLYGPGVSENRCDLPMLKLTPAQVRKSRKAIKALVVKLGLPKKLARM